MLIINNINVSLDFDFKNFEHIAASALKTDVKNIKSASLYRKSVDARKKNNVHFCISVLADVLGDTQKYLKQNKNVSVFKENKYIYKKVSSVPDIRPIIAGFGPAGMFAGLVLSLAGLRPIIIERGFDVDTRTKDIEAYFGGGALKENSNVQFGEGGAGTFSDGKLNTGIKDERCREVLRLFTEFGADKNILTDAKPHIGTDVLKIIVKNIRNRIISLGGEVRFGSTLDGIFSENGKLCAITVNKVRLPCERLLLCIGHSARDTFKMLKESNISMVRKPFAMGVRIEHLQSDINNALYGDFAKHIALGAADYKLVSHLENGRSVYTFCMCPGGEVINASSDLGGIAVNGMSKSARDGVNANSAVLVGVNPEDIEGDDVLGGCTLQQQIESAAYKKGKSFVPVTTVGRFVYGNDTEICRIKPTVRPFIEVDGFDGIFPKFIEESLRLGIADFGKKIKGFDCFDAVLSAAETRSSSPVRIVRDESGNSVSVLGFYPCGEGAGYAGGIMSAAVDGIKCAEKIIDSYLNP